MPESVLVTGGAGFIGSHLVERLLAEGHDVHLVDDISTGRLDNLAAVRSHAKLHLIVDSITNWPMVNDTARLVDRVIHLAAVEGLRRNLDEPVETMKTNVRGTEILLDVCGKRELPIFIASSADVYGLSGGLLREDSALVLGSPHEWRWWQATTKLMGESLGLAYHREQGLPVVVGRLFNVVGPRQSGRWGMVLPIFVKQALAGEPLEVYGTGEQRRAFVHVGDAVDAILGLIHEPEAQGGIFNVGSQEEVTIMELAERVKARTGSDSEIRTVPHPEEYGEDFRELERRQPDLTRIRETLGWEPEKSLDETIDEVAEYFRERAGVA
ncbi:MAG: NAD-dependent epimerase/dehydratase family protein [Gemmatimonadetes bacterium]|nr:NAD-dependent epimerase/dehydratase family protein [Gemmatimonadota bacterium]NIR77463.1 NAD-dependent epimerase/dehydratase family protein [Gemmatimonadota bacterium]NIT85987.1 NAD-dependent epimerase/dehydratase family protein [Gemmatimonadota bacterium]NIU29807.1 NAD-dependent epimerase/dehydratase family protein [Gemmatimonadota bacterium]NIU34829.1 NAD-dependent epimerase/dehydratase family protein [Gemmatimonadota bacterium]